MIVASSASDPAVNKIALYNALGNNEKTWNTVPFPLPNMKKVTEREFWANESTWTTHVRANGGQIQLNNPNPPYGTEWGHLMLYFVNHGRFTGGGYAVMFYYWRKENPVEYYEWCSCDHSFKETNISNCYNKYTCTKCGASYTVDSSD